MDRMVRKGLLQTQQIRNLTLFSTTVDEVEAKRGEFYRMLKRAFDGALAPMMQFLVEHEAFGGGSPSAPGDHPPAYEGGEIGPCG
jgi:predicted transcriptional regulator